MLKGAEALTPWFSHICVQAQAALTRRRSHFCGGANVNEHGSTSGTANKERSIKHLQCRWVFPQVSYCLFLLSSSGCGAISCRARQDVGQICSVQPWWRVTCGNGHQLMMRLQKQNKSALLWVEFSPADRQPAQKAHGAGFVHKRWSMWRSWWQLKDTFWKPSVSLTGSATEDPGTALILRVILLFSIFFYFQDNTELYFLPSFTARFFTMLDSTKASLHFNRCIFHRKLMYCFPKAISVCKLHCSLPSCTVFQPAKTNLVPPTALLVVLAKGIVSASYLLLGFSKWQSPGGWISLWFFSRKPPYRESAVFS